jgi:hypothetical protein
LGVVRIAVDPVTKDLGVLTETECSRTITTTATAAARPSAAAPSATPADLIEGDVFASVANGVLPAGVIAAARTELRKLLETPEVAVAGRQRARLVTASNTSGSSTPGAT